MSPYGTSRQAAPLSNLGRYWSKADIGRRFSRHWSDAIDPLRKSGGPKCCNAQRSFGPLFDSQSESDQNLWSLGQHRSTQRKVPRGRDDEQRLAADIIALARRGQALGPVWMLGTSNNLLSRSAVGSPCS